MVEDDEDLTLMIMRVVECGRMLNTVQKQCSLSGGPPPILAYKQASLLK